MKKITNIILSSILVIFFIGTLGPMVYAISIPSPSSVFYVYDEADVLTDETEKHIVNENIALYEQCGAQIVVACVNSTGLTGIEDYAYRLFNEWQIGSKEKNNGVLILLAVKDDNYYVLQGIGLEDLLSSGTIKILLDEYMEPYFAVQDYDSGVAAFFKQIHSEICDIYSIDGYTSDYSGNDSFYVDSSIYDDNNFSFVEDNIPFYSFFDDGDPFFAGHSIFSIAKAIIKLVIKFAIKFGIFTVVVIVIVIHIIKKRKRRSKQNNPYAGQQQQYTGPYSTNDNPSYNQSNTTYEQTNAQETGPINGEYSTPPEYKTQTNRSNKSDLFPFILGEIVGSVLSGQRHRNYPHNSSHRGPHDGGFGGFPGGNNHHGGFGGSSHGGGFGGASHGGGGASRGGGAGRG